MQQKELATLLDISPAMVSRLAKRGMPTDSLERAERWRRRHLEPGRVKGARLDQPGSPKPTPATRPARAAADTADDAPQGGDPNASEPTDEAHHQARTRREKAEASMAELRLAELRGELIQVAAVRAAFGAALTATRDRLLSIPDRLAPVLAAESAPQRVHEVMSAEIRDALAQLSAAPWSLSRQAASPGPEPGFFMVGATG